MVFFNGCKKIDTSSHQTVPTADNERFFNLPAATSPYVARVAALLQQRNAKKEFVNRFTKQNGFPVWDKVFALNKPKNAGSSFAGTTITDTIIYIPLVLQGDTVVNGFISARLHDSITINYSLASDYKSYPDLRQDSLPSNKDFALLIMKLNQLTFGYNEFLLTDSSLFKETKTTAFGSQPTVKTVRFKNSEAAPLLSVHGQNNVLIQFFCEDVFVSICATSASTPLQGNLQSNAIPGRNCYNTTFEVCWEMITFTPGGGENPDPGGEPSGGGGGGGNGLPHYYPCPGSGNPFTAPICPPPGGGLGWVPLPLEEQPTEILLDYTDLGNPIFVPDDIILMPHGFNFQFQAFNAVTDPPIKTIGKIEPRGNTEDMDWGYNGDVAGILSMMPNFTDQQLFDEVEDLFHKTSTGPLQTVGDNMIDRFRNNTGGVYSNPNLSQQVFENSKFKEFIVKFGVRLNQALENANWNIDNVGTIEIPTEERPIFNGLHNKFNGLQILINDTEETTIELTGFSINPTTHKWVANLNIIIKDHFGLDKNDALTYQNNHAGFAAWWLLQHTRGYKPFETQVKFKMDLIAE